MILVRPSHVLRTDSTELMKYRCLGDSGLAVSNLCLGTMTFGQVGWGCDADTASGILWRRAWVFYLMSGSGTEANA